MKKYKPNKIWGCITTSEAIEELHKYPFFFANKDHILVISNEQPKGTVEMTEEFIKRFKADDWQFINSVVIEVRKAQMEEYPDEAKLMEEYNEEFLKRFRQELEAVRVGAAGNAEKQ